MDRRVATRMVSAQWVSYGVVAVTAIALIVYFAIR
jgi:hypothetical protein